jgi:hypothetical protein
MSRLNYIVNSSLPQEALIMSKQQQWRRRLAIYHRQTITTQQHRRQQCDITVSYDAVDWINDM